MFEEFIRERQYVTNVTPRTIEWYRQSFKWLDNPNPTQRDLTDFVIRMRQAGLQPSSCNNRIRAVNAYLKFIGSTLHVPRMKEPVKVLPSFSAEDIQKFVRWNPGKAYGRRRLQVLILMLADTGLRINEALSLKWQDVDFDNMLLRAYGKGQKERLVPFSFELRRVLWKFRHEYTLVFSTRTGNKPGRRMMLREVKNLCRKLDIAVPQRTLHAFRHAFALNYLRRGGSVFHLQRALGHTSLDMSRRYANLTTADLQNVHQKISLLTR